MVYVQILNIQTQDNYKGPQYEMFYHLLNILENLFALFNFVFFKKSIYLTRLKNVVSPIGR